MRFYNWFHSITLQKPFFHKCIQTPNVNHFTFNWLQSKINCDNADLNTDDTIFGMIQIEGWEDRRSRWCSSWWVQSEKGWWGVLLGLCYGSNVFHLGGGCGGISSWKMAQQWNFPTWISIQVHCFPCLLSLFSFNLLAWLYFFD